MRAYWYTDNPKSTYGNVGDMLTPIIIEHFTGNKPEYVSANTPGKLLACGSVAEFIQDGDTVWGSGIIQPMQLDKSNRVNILAVRGKLTARQLRSVGYDVPEVYGDPAVLMPEIYHPIPKPKYYSIGYMPHYIEADAWHKAFGLTKPYLNVINEPKHFIDEMLKCHKIITSSLHAYILAQAYGIQAEYLQLTSKIIGGYFKYEDYISGRGDTEKFKEVFKMWCKTH